MHKYAFGVNITKLKRKIIGFIFMQKDKQTEAAGLCLEKCVCACVCVREVCVDA